MERDLKKEKKELQELFFEKLKSVKNNRDIKEIAEKVDALNDALDIHDSRFANFIDGICVCFSPSLESKIRKRINDILDNYDKVNKDKTPVYSDEERASIARLLQEIDTICNRNFWDRFKTVLGIGT